MYQAARLAKERIRALDFVDANEIVDEFARSIRQELDYRLEARNADAFHRDFAGHPHVAVPRVYWTYTRSRVLTLEYLDGVQLADLELDAWSLEQRRHLAYLITETWMTMIFRNGFFHGDPHPANILVLSPERIGLVDFGLTGKLTDDDMSKLTRLFIDAASENIEMLPKRLADLGVRYPKEREEEFVAELRDLYYRYYGASLKEIDPIQVIREAFGLIYAMNLRLPTRFVMLDKAIATLGSVGIELYPDFNVFEVAKPYARDLMLERFTPRRMALRARRESWQLTQMALELPYQIHDTLEQVRDGQIEVGFVHKGLDDLMAKLDTLFNRLVIALVVTGGLIGSSLIGIFAKTRPARARAARRLGARLPALGDPRRLAALGRHPLRPALTLRPTWPHRPVEDRSAQNRANGQLVRRGRPGYRRVHGRRTAPRRRRARDARVPRAAPPARRVRARARSRAVRSRARGRRRAARPLGRACARDRPRARAGRRRRPDPRVPARL